MACSDGGDSRPDTRPKLDLTFTPAPIDLPGITANYAQDVRYGDGERNLFDIYLPDCDEPTPLVIYIHGGGFTGGDKSGTHIQNADAIREFLQSCIAYATINYVLLDVPSEEEGTGSIVAQGGVLPSLQDAARALQFMRYHANNLNLDKDNAASFGGSAGAGASLWLGTHDDMADPGNVDMLGLMDSGDAPIFVRNFDIGFDDFLNLFLHHGLHALAVKARADEVGLHSVAYVDGDPIYGFEDPSGEELVPFLTRHIQ